MSRHGFFDNLTQFYNRFKVPFIFIGLSLVLLMTYSYYSNTSPTGESIYPRNQMGKGNPNSKINGDSQPTKASSRISPSYRSESLLPTQMPSYLYNNALQEMKEANTGWLERRILILNFTYSIVQRDFDKDLTVETTNAKALQDPRIPYFTYWNGGESKWPDIVKKCINSTSRNLAQTPERFNYVILDDNTIPNWVTFSDSILQARKYMTVTYFSDILRVYLLSEYGGIWSDAAVYMLNPPPDQVLQADFFAHKRWHDPWILSSWWMSARDPNSYIFIWLRHVLNEYWKTHTDHSYFDFHYFVESLKNLLPEARRQFYMAPWYSSYQAHTYFRMATSNSYDEKLFKAAPTFAFVQKFTWKSPVPFIDKLP